MKQFENQVDTPYSAQSSSSTTYVVDVVRDVYIAPGGAALFVGFLVAIVATLLLDATDLPLSLWKFFLVVWGLGGAFLFWAFYTGAVQRVEKATKRDINGDGYIGKPPAPALPPKIINVELYNEQGQLYGGERIIEQEADYLTILAQGFAANRPLTEGEWAREIPRAEFNAIRDRLIASGLATYRNGHNLENGWMPTKRGEKVLRDIAESS